MFALKCEYLCVLLCLCRVFCANIRQCKRACGSSNLLWFNVIVLDCYHACLCVYVYRKLLQQISAEDVPEWNIGNVACARVTVGFQFAYGLCKFEHNLGCQQSVVGNV